MLCFFENQILSAYSWILSRNCQLVDANNMKHGDVSNWIGSNGGIRRESANRNRKHYKIRLTCLKELSRKCFYQRSWLRNVSALAKCLLLVHFCLGANGTVAVLLPFRPHRFSLVIMQVRKSLSGTKDTPQYNATRVRRCLICFTYTRTAVCNIP